MPQEDISREEILSCGLPELGVLRVEPVVSESDGRLWNRLVETYHYLGTARMFGPRIRYLVRCDLDERPLALFGYTRASLKVGGRESFVGWDEKTKLKHIDRVVCQNRFLILPHREGRMLWRIKRFLPCLYTRGMRQAGISLRKKLERTE